MRSSTFASLAIVAFGLAPQATAFFYYTRGPSCTYTGPGVACPAFDDGSGTGATISGTTCAPDGRCGDDGSVCSSSNDCYNYCGMTDGICGGAGAGCNSVDPTTQTADENAVTCFTPGFTCDVTNQVCLVAASAGHRRNKKRNAQACEKQGWTTCSVANGGSRSSLLSWECVDTKTSLEQCGGCDAASGGVDCTTIPGASGVECQAGACVVQSCEEGQTLFDGACF